MPADDDFTMTYPCYFLYAQIRSNDAAVEVIVTSNKRPTQFRFESGPRIDQLKRWDCELHFESAWEFIAMVPHCFLVLAIALTAIIPWITWSNRFSLRTLIIATTLVAVGLGLIVWAAK